MQTPMPANPDRTLTHSDMPHTLERLAILLDHPQTPEFTDALRILIKALVSWGEILDLSDFVAFAHKTEALLHAHPDQVSIIAPLALHGFHAIYEQQVQREQQGQHLTVGSETKPPLTTDSKEESFISSPSIRDTMTDSSTPLPPLPTTHLFVWEAQSFIFTVPSEQVLEIVIPDLDQLIQSGQTLNCHWRGQMIPVYQISAASPEPGSVQIEAALEIHRVPESVPSMPSLLIIRQGDQILALATQTDALLTESSLPLTLMTTKTSLPSYCYGYTSLGNRNHTPVLNLADLFNQRLQSQPDSLPVSANDTDQETTFDVPRRTPVQALAPTIMCVDDSLALRNTLGHNLTEAGYEVVLAENGQVAINQLHEHPGIQLVICDIEMPKMNGFEFLRYCRHDPNYAELPIVILSMSKSALHEDLAHRLGANAYFCNPYNEIEFLATLQALLEA